MAMPMRFVTNIFGLLYVVFIYSKETCALNFTIDYANDTFLKDGKPFQYISGTMHYARTPPFYWRDRLLKMRAAGFNTVQTYIFWNIHEPEARTYNFTGQQDVVAFIKTAQSCGLHVIIRGLPYSCAEWDFGGLPGWLLTKSPNVVVRSIDPAFMNALDPWMDVILNKLKPLLYKNGGPIISVQIENEYGSYFACDYTYIRYLRNKMMSVFGPDVVLFTTDGDGDVFLKCGAIEGAYATIDFGLTTDPEMAFKPQRRVQPKGPLVNSELYVGWLDLWKHNHSHVDANSSAQSIDALLAYGANVNVYVVAGGTNFGFYNGAEYPPFAPVPTSYDYDGVLSEAGDITKKYMLIRKVLLKYNPSSPIPVPPSTKKFAYGNVDLHYCGDIYTLLPHISFPPITSEYPLTMEQMKQYYGFVVYRHKLTASYKTPILHIPGLRDRAYVAVNDKPFGVLVREQALNMTLDDLHPGDQLNILVENQGHICFGSGLNNNSKGILGNVTINGQILTQWSMFKLKMDTLNAELMWDLASRSVQHGPKRWQRNGKLYTLPSLFSGSLKSDVSPMDTFLDPRPFTKGQAFINSVNIGRYWTVAGPQVTLFVPKVFLQQSSAPNYVTMFELEDIPHSSSLLSINFSDIPYINKTIPSLLETTKLPR